MGENPKWMEEVAQAGGFQEHHIQNLQKELELKKQEVELMKEMAKITPETWGSIKESVKGLNSFVQGGGLGAMETGIVEGFKETILGNIQTSIDSALSPIYNEINQQMSQLLGPINQQLSNIMNNLSQFISSGPTGGAWGGLIGGIGGYLIGGPAGGKIGELMGVIVGAAVEHIMNTVNSLKQEMFPDWPFPENIFGGGTPWRWPWEPVPDDTDEQLPDESEQGHQWDQRLRGR